MKNILHWTLGGFFRTIGRYLAIALIMFGIGAILSLNGFKLPSWLGLGYVNAATTNWTSQEVRLHTDNTWSNYYTVNGTNVLELPSSLYDTELLDAIAYRFNWSSGLSSSNTYKIKFAYKFLPSNALTLTNYYAQNSRTEEREQLTCSISVSDNIYHWFTCTFSPTHDYLSTDYLYIKINFNFYNYLSDFRVRVDPFEEFVDTNSVVIDVGDNIINNNNQNTQEIIDSLNQANENLLNGITEQNLACKFYDKSIIEKDNYYISNNNGTETPNINYGITKYIDITNSSKIYSISTTSANGTYGCFYDNYKTKISCLVINDNRELTIPTNARYIRWTINKYHNVPQLKICNNGNQAINDSLNNINDVLTDVDTSSSSNYLYDYIQNMNLSIEGPLSQIVLLPINFISSIVDYNANDSHPSLCTVFANQNICIPSGDLVWKRNGAHEGSPFGRPNYSQFKTFFQLIVGGIIYWRLLKKLVKTIEGVLDPTNSEMEMIKL